MIAAKMAARAAAAIPVKSSYNLIDEPAEDLKCLVCEGVALQPWQHGKCGRLFCKQCLEDYGKDKPCPECKTEPQYFEDSRSKKNINVLRVKCNSMDKGCGWEGTVGLLEEHVTTCEFMQVPCPKQCKDDNGIVYFVKKDLHDHLEKDCPNRDSKCEYCEEKGTFASITQMHHQVCAMKPIQCPNAKCTGMMLKAGIQEHVDNECEYAEVACKYSSIGCSVQTIRKDIASHEMDDDKLHLHLALNVVAHLKETAAKPQQMPKQPYGLTFKLSNYRQKKEQNAKFVSPLFYTSSNGYSIAVRVDVGGHGEAAETHISVFALVLTGEYDFELRWPFQGKITFTLLNQLEDMEHFEKSLKVEASHNVQPGDLGRGFFKFISHAELAHDPVKNTQYLKDDTLYFRVTVDVDDHKPWLECKAT